MQWRFALAGSAQVTLRLGDGMDGQLHRSGSDRAPARIVGTFTGRLEAGSYVLEASSLGRNDRLSYSVTLDSDELQPDGTAGSGLAGYRSLRDRPGRAWSA